MKEISLEVKRAQAALLLFYRPLLLFSILLAMLIFLGEYFFNLIQPGTADFIQTLLYFLKRFSFRLPTYLFLGALGFTHIIQGNQYYYYRNQGCTIKSLIFMSWILNCLLGAALLILIKIAANYV